MTNLQNQMVHLFNLLRRMWNYVLPVGNIYTKAERKATLIISADSCVAASLQLFNFSASTRAFNPFASLICGRARRHWHCVNVSEREWVCALVREMRPHTHLLSSRWPRSLITQCSRSDNTWVRNCWARHCGSSSTSEATSKGTSKTY